MYKYLLSHKYWVIIEMRGYLTTDIERKQQKIQTSMPV